MKSMNPDGPTRKMKSEPAQYFTEVYKAVITAGNKSGGFTENFFHVAGFTVKLSFAGPALIENIIPAIQHLSAQYNPAPGLKVYLWDSSSTGVEMPSLPWKIHDHLISGEFWSFNNDLLMIIYRPALKTIIILNKITGEAIYWVKDASRVPFHDKASPLRMIFQRWLQGLGKQVTHAGAVGLPGKGVLLAGKGGSGKSVAAFACLNSELFYAGDDYCVINDEPIPFVHCLYNTGKLNSSDLDKFPLLKPAVSGSGNNPDGKSLFFFNSILHDRISPGFPVVAILIPRITGKSETRLTRTSPATGFLALAPTTVFQLNSAEKRLAHEKLDKFVRKVPNYFLESGTDMKKIPEVIYKLLTRTEP